MEVKDIPQVTDRASFRLGLTYCFCEMIHFGVKRLALSAPLDPPADYENIQAGSAAIADYFGVKTFLEKDFLVTDLFSAELTDGKHVLLVCHPATFDEYEALKSEMRALEESGEYDAAARERIARRFGELLSYSDEKIDALLASGADD